MNLRNSLLSFALSSFGLAAVVHPAIGQRRAYSRAELEALPIAHLVALLTYDSVQEFIEIPHPDAYLDTLRQVLVRRNATDTILAAYDSTTDDDQIYQLVQILTHLRSPSVDSTLLKFSRPDSLSFRALFSLMYFADLGQPWALSILNKNFWDYQVPNPARQEIIAVFGKYRYAPGAGNLVKALYALNMTTFGMAADALQQIYPEASDSTHLTIEGVQQFWEHYVPAHQADSLKKAP